MNSYNEQRNAQVRKQILDALISMMKTQDYHSIGVSAIVETAHVGRASFYRNYTSKEDVLRQEAETVINEWSSDPQNSGSSSPVDFLESLFTHFRENKELCMALYVAGMSDILLDIIVKKIGIDPSMTNEEAYAKSSLAYMIFGWVNEWIKRGMEETGTELKDMLLRNSAGG